MGETASRVALGVVTGGISEVARPFTKNLLKTPTPPQFPGAPGTDTPAVQTAVAEAAARRSRARGFQSTILSNPGSAPKQTLGT